MKKTTFNLIARFGLCFALLMGASQAQALLLSFDGPTSVGVGESFSVDVVASDVTAGISAFDFDVNFDDSLLGFDGYTLGSSLTDPLFGQLDLSNGLLGATVNLAETSFLLDFSAQASSFVLGTLEFTGLSNGLAAIDFGFLDFTDGDLIPQTISNVSSSGLSVAVPEPHPAMLMLMGLVAMLAVRFRRKWF